jgi:hypothetical protein
MDPTHMLPWPLLLCFAAVCHPTVAAVLGEVAAA